ncbi:zinc finger and BTB domain-containing protein 24-like [Maniola hyperantus]|uniref:zinc finger and BTB domain-containing protein 24-like n=1 Tax=Aphantopus hyperantus TaxID=2795564 RepID=UPI001569F58C|nr:zinc finger and BTB domain-containing protein 24-like [Maniola hyperantus]
MSDQEEFEGEIEFLDEDADIVQQCVPNVEKRLIKADPGSQDSGSGSTRMLYELLVDRTDEKQDNLKRKRKNDDDSDYDPKEDMLNMLNRKKKRRSVVPQNVQRERIVEFVPKPQIKKDPFDFKMDLGARRKLQLKVPDYDDPLCLPVRALRKDPAELQKLRNWNNLCLEHFKSYDSLLRVDKHPTIASKRVVIFKNLHNRASGKVETTVSAKLSIENINGEKRTEVTQSVLPKYREKKLLNIRLTNPKKRRAFYKRDEAILTKEVDKGDESLVVYKPSESLSLVYKIFDNNGAEKQSVYDEEDRRYLKEVASCKVCAPCYQTSWRAFKTTDNKKILCSICKRPCISLYNMLAHMKSHSNAAVRACKKEIAQCLASAVEYHYKCKICDEKHLSIKALRLHVKTHKGTDSFRCEVCNRNIISQ